MDWSRTQHVKDVELLSWIIYIYEVELLSWIIYIYMYMYVCMYGGQHYDHFNCYPQHTASLHDITSRLMWLFGPSAVTKLECNEQATELITTLTADAVHSVRRSWLYLNWTRNISRCMGAETSGRGRSNNRPGQVASRHSVREGIGRNHFVFESFRHVRMISWNISLPKYNLLFFI